MNESEFKKILQSFENDNLEFKKDIERIDKKEEKYRLAKTAVAFYNTQGGKIILGVKENGTDRKVVGLKNPQLVENNFNTQIRAKCNIYESPAFEFLKYNGKQILIINCPKGGKPPYKFEGNVLIRRGSNNMPATDDEIARMYRDRSDDSYDRTIVEGADLNDIDLHKAFDYVDMINILEKEPVNEDKLRILNNIGILKKNRSNNYTPTIAGILLFGKNPQVFFPQAKIKASIKYDNSKDEWDDVEEICGTVIEQIAFFGKFIKRNIRKSVKVVGFKRIEEPMIPIEVMREAIVNAVVHRDYSDVSASTLVNITQDNIVILSPGVIIPPLSLDTILKGYFNPRSRNNIIADVVFQSGYMERRGNGIITIRNLIRKQGLKDPIFREDAGSFIININSTKSKEHDERITIPDDIWEKLELNHNQKEILLVIEKKQEAQLKDFEKALNKTRGAFIKSLDNLLEKEIIQRFPKRPKKSPRAYYTIHSRFKIQDDHEKEDRSEQKALPFKNIQ